MDGATCGARDSTLQEKCSEFFNRFGNWTYEELRDIVYSSNSTDTEKQRFMKKLDLCNHHDQGTKEHMVSKELMLYMSVIIVILGTLGNSVSLVVLCQRAMRKTSTYVYLAVLAIADTSVLYIGLVPSIDKYTTGSNARDRSDWSCKIILALHSATSHFAAWLIVSVTVERYIAVCHPLQASQMCKVRRAKMVMVGLFASFVMINIHFFWTVKLVCGSCRFVYKEMSVVWPWIDTIIYSLLPFVTIVVLNVMIIIQVSKARQYRQDMQVSVKQSTRERHQHENNIRLTIMLVTVSFVFLLTTLPFGIVTVVSSAVNRDLSDKWNDLSKLTIVRSIAKLLMYTNHSINFFLYCATGNKFRRQIWKLFSKSERTTYRFKTEMSNPHRETLCSNNGKCPSSPTTKIDQMELKYCEHQPLFNKSSPDVLNTTSSK